MSGGPSICAVIRDRDRLRVDRDANRLHVLKKDGAAE